MITAVLAALIAFGLSFMALTLVDLLIHRLTKNPDKSYKWGVWTFSILAALWAFITNLGR